MDTVVTDLCPQLTLCQGEAARCFLLAWESTAPGGQVGGRGEGGVWGGGVGRCGEVGI